MPNDTGMLVVLAGILVWYLHNENEDGSGDDETDYLGGDGDMTAQTNERAFLAAIRVGEGTARANGYRLMFGGAPFASDSDHPAMLGWRGGPLSDAMCRGAGFGPGCVSTAAGAYQITKPTWQRVRARLGLSDFSSASQDAAALELINEKGALEDVHAGRVAVAVDKVRKVWASLPGAGYGQRQVSLSGFINDYVNAGGTIE